MSNRARERRLARSKTKQAEPAVLAWMYGDDVAGPFMNSIAKTFMDDALMGDRARFVPAEGGYLSMSSGPMIVVSRNNIVRQFLEGSKAGWLVMVDSDMCWGSGDVHRLIDEAEEHEYDILGGLCFAAARQGGEMYPTIYVADGHQTGTTMPDCRRILDYPRDAIVTCDGTGAAFFAVNRKTLLAMFEKYRYYTLPGDDGPVTCANPHPWFAETYTPTGGYYGEDLTFCLRARGLGAKLGVHTGIKVGHVKPRILAEREWDAQQAGPNPVTETRTNM